jgi:thiamine thiazole synthase
MMFSTEISEIEITKAIVKNAIKDFLDSTSVDVAIVGGGPSGLIAGVYLANENLKVALFERKLGTGGGMWGGGMLFPRIVIQKEAKFILDDCGIKSKKSEFFKNGACFIVNSIEAVAKITAKAIDSGVKIFNGIAVEDVIIREKKINGVVINWSSVELAKLHVDPLAVQSNFVIDATGHNAEVCRIVQRKVGTLDTSSGDVMGERSMWAEKSESLVVENTKEVYSGLFVTGMAANTVFGAPRMGPIFGGMFLSGKRASELIVKKIKTI